MVSRVEWHGQSLYLVKPVTDINHTGSVLSRLGQRFGLRPSGLILVHDDIDLPLGTVRQRMKGGSGGHRGVGSVLECFQTEALRRVKIGVGRPQRNIPAIEYVLSPFPPAAQLVIERACAVASERVLALVASGVESLTGIAPNDLHVLARTSLHQKRQDRSSQTDARCYSLHRKTGNNL